MKLPVAIALALLVLVAPAASQEPMEGQIMYCDDAGCQWINDPQAQPAADYPPDPYWSARPQTQPRQAYQAHAPQAPAYPDPRSHPQGASRAQPAYNQDPYAHDPYSRPVQPPPGTRPTTTGYLPTYEQRQYQAGQGHDAPAYHDPYAQPPANDSGYPVDPYTGRAIQHQVPGSGPVILYGYSPLSLPPAIEPRPPNPLCPRSRGQALAQFAKGVELGDINRVISTYEWTGMDSGQADRIISQLAAIAPGSWQRRYVQASFDADFSSIEHEQSFRWTQGASDPGVAFNLVQNSQCWFVQMA